MEALTQHADVPRAPRRPVESEPTAMVGFRLPVSLIQDIDAEAEAMAPPGVRLSRTDAIRALLTEAIATRRKGRRSK